MKIVQLVNLFASILIALALVHNPVYADHVKDNDGNTILHWDDFTDFSVTMDETFTADDIRTIRSLRVIGLNQTIQSLPDSNFTHPASVSRDTLISALNEVNDLVKRDGLYNAILKLEEIKKTMDGIGSDDLITDPIGKEQVLPIVDGIINSSIAGSMPSNQIQKKSEPKLEKVMYIIAIILGAIIAGLLIVLGYGSTRKKFKCPHGDNKSFKKKEELDEHIASVHAFAGLQK